MRLALLFCVFPFALAAQQAGAPSGATLTAQQLFDARRLDEAKSAFATRLSAHATDADAMYHLGRIALMQDRRKEAIDWLEKAIRQDDRNAVYHFWLGSALGDEAQQASKLRQPFLARRVKSEFERAAALDSAYVDPRIGLADFYSIAPGFMGGSMDKAREQAAAIARLNPMRGHLVNARLALRAKDDSTYVREHEAAIRTAPDSTAPYIGLASFYRTRNRLADALAVLDRFIAARPAEAAMRATWGVYAVLGGVELERAERELRFFLANAPAQTSPMSFANVHARLGMLYEKTGRSPLARAEYETALRYIPTHADARKALNALK